MMERAGSWASSIENNRWMQVLAFCFLIASQIVFFGYVFSSPNSRLTDYHVYDVFSTAAAKGLDPYSLKLSDVDAIASTRWGLKWQELPILPPSGISGMLGLHYSPPFFVLFRPLTALPPLEGARVWFVICCAALDLAVFLLSAVRQGRWIDPAICVLTAVFGPALQTLEGGQINTLLLLAVVIALYGLARGKPALIGLGLSSAILIRPLPAILALCVLLLWRRELRGVIWSSLGLIFFAALTLPISGSRVWGEYISEVVSFGSKAVGDNYVEGVSIWTLLNRVLPDRTALALGMGISVCIIAIVLFGLWQERGRDWVLEVSLILAGALLVTPGTWYHYLVLLLIPIAYLLRGFNPQVLNLRLAPIQFCVLLAFVLFEVHVVTWRRFESQPYLSSWGTIGLALLFSALIWQILSQSHRAGQLAFAFPRVIADSR